MTGDMKKTVIGCTGGIGSGKSAIVGAFAALGIPAYDCDSAAKALYRTDRDLCRAVALLLGPQVLQSDGTLSMREMAARVFSGRGLLEKVEAIVHPAVGEDFRKWAARQKSDIVIMESAILLEKPFFDTFADCTIAVSAPEEVRIARVMVRDGVTREQVEARLANQWSDSLREQKADIVIVTDDRTPVLPRILELIETLKQTTYNHGNRS